MGSFFSAISDFPAGDITPALLVSVVRSYADMGVGPEAFLNLTQARLRELAPELPCEEIVGLVEDWHRLGGARPIIDDVVAIMLEEHRIPQLTRPLVGRLAKVATD